MQAEDRPIHFATELIHPPLQHKTPTLQRLYFELSQTRAASYESSDFSAPGPPKFHSRRGKAQSVVLFLPDRLVMIEEWVDSALSAFTDKVREVATRAKEVLGLPAFVAQTATVRTTFALTHFEDARVFLMDHACAQEGRIGCHFGRPIGIAGLRFVLPEMPDHPGALHVTIESFRHSRNEVFVEVKGVFTRLQAPVDEVGELAERIHLVRAFISNHVFPYLNQYDTPQPPSE